MQIDKNNLVKHKLDYLKLALKISKFRYQGDEPPKELSQQAHKVSRLASIYYLRRRIDKSLNIT